MVIREGCMAFRRPKLRICDLGCKVRLYMIKGLNLEGVLESDRKESKS